MKSFKRAGTRRAGFTLLELLIVIAVSLAVLGIAGAVISRGRTSARAAICLNNLKQVALAIQMYEANRGTLPASLAQLDGAYLDDIRFLRCPADHNDEGSFPSSYEPFFVNRPLHETGRIFLGCPRHPGEHTPTVFGWPRFFLANSLGIRHDGMPVDQGTEVTGGTLTFADGTRVEIAPGITVGVMFSLSDPEGRVYSTVYLPDGESGSLEVNHPEGVDSLFEVITPSLITGVAGTRFKVEVETQVINDEGSEMMVSRTVVTVFEGAVLVQERSRPEVPVVLVTETFSESGIVASTPEEIKQVEETREEVRNRRLPSIPPRVAARLPEHVRARLEQLGFVF